MPTDDPFLRGYYGPVNIEADAGHLRSPSDMPRELLGTLYRDGPDPHSPRTGPSHWFGGDDMIHAFHVENGNVSYKNRWVRTPKWEIENKEGEGLSGSFGHPLFTDPRCWRCSRPSPTPISSGTPAASWRSRRRTRPLRSIPRALEPKGYETYGDRLNGPFTAHPKIDPRPAR